MTTTRHRSVLSLVSMGALTLVLGGQGQVADAQKTPQRSQQKTSSKRYREGDTLNQQRGAFHLAGGRITFHPEGGGALRVLENLALERIGNELEKRPDREWIAGGKVTEYRGGNYLLVSRAVQRRRNSRTQPSRKTKKTADRAVKAEKPPA